MSEPDYTTLDPLIRETVRWLRSHGFDTCDSGDGSKADRMEGAMDIPMVAIRATRDTLLAEVDRLYALLVAAGIDMEPSEQRIRQLESSYSPVDQVALILLLGVTDYDVPGDEALFQAMDDAADRQKAAMDESLDRDRQARDYVRD